MFDFLWSPEAWLSLLMLSTMEIVLGIDNLIFISILVGKVAPELQDKARRLGMAGAFCTRIILLLFIGWIIGLKATLFSAFGFDFSGKSIILMLGGLFLIYKATSEIHAKLEGEEEHVTLSSKGQKFSTVIIQIMLLDIVFSLDSVITAVGMAQHLPIMIAANVVALIVMLLVGAWVHGFIEKHPTLKILALSFLLMIGLVLVGDGLGFHIPKGYIYFAMGFSIFVADKFGWNRYVCHQAYYSLVGREYEWELMPLALDQKIGTMVWSPLGWGRLTGKIRRGQPLPDQSRLHQTKEQGPPVEDEYLYRVVDALDEVARETDHSISQVALNWLLQRPSVSNVVVGARNEEQLKQNLGCLGWSLSPEQIAKLDLASRQTPTAPYWHQTGFKERNPFPTLI